MGIDLSGTTPADPSRPQGILELIHDGIGGIGQAFADGFNGMIGMIADALFGAGPGEPLVRMSDGMTDLNERLDLLDDVPGYAGAWMSTNRNFGSGSTFKTVPFDRPYGPPKNAELNPSNHRMYISQGSWSVHLTIVPQGLFEVVNVGHSVRARVRNASGQVMIDRQFDWVHPPSEHAQHFGMPLIVPPESAPWSIEIGYRHATGWWPLRGGTDRTLIWVERKNLDSSNHDIETDVPDGPNIP